MAERVPAPGDFYRHFKNKLYQVIAIAEHTETGEAMVVYQALYEDFKTYVRPLEEFLGEVDRDKYPGAMQKYRFEYVAPGELGGRGARVQLNEEMKEQQRKERKSRLETWRNSNHSEQHDDELWKSLTDEALKASEEIAGDAENSDGVSPKFLDFLEARTFESKKMILESMKNELDDEMIDGLAMAIDVEIPAGSFEERYHELRQCLDTMAKFEDTRPR